MRVIAGSARGIQLNTLEGLKTRPTTDRVKEAIFSMIHHDILDKKILDLFSGSGAMGIEFLSRGGAFACFVDTNKQLDPIIKANLKKTRLDEKSKILIMDAHQALKIIRDMTFDFIFLDPPYASGEIDGVLDAIAQSGVLAESGIVIIEHDSKESVAHNSFTILKVKKYGKVGVTVLRRKDENSSLSR